MNSEDEALVTLGRALLAAGYQFTALGPESHRRVNSRPGVGIASSLEEVFGWNRPFEAKLLSDDWLELLNTANVLQQEGQLLRASVRLATVEGGLYVHSGFPTMTPDAVELNSDTYRFVSLLRRSALRAECAVEVGCGAGAGALASGGAVMQWILADINPRALRFSRVNAAINGWSGVEYVHSDVLADVASTMDLVIAHPPFAIEREGNMYRSGGGPMGTEVAVRIVKESLERLPPGGRLVMFSTTPVVRGRDVLQEQLGPVFQAYDVPFEYLELDPDSESDLLELAEYSQVDRLAKVALSAVIPGRR